MGKAAETGRGSRVPARADATTAGTLIDCWHIPPPEVRRERLRGFARVLVWTGQEAERFINANTPQPRYSRW